MNVAAKLGVVTTWRFWLVSLLAGGGLTELVWACAMYNHGR